MSQSPNDLFAIPYVTYNDETNMIVPNTNRNELKRSGNPRSENPGYANWSEANSIRPLKNKLFTDENSKSGEYCVCTIVSSCESRYGIETVHPGGD